MRQHQPQPGVPAQHAHDDDAGHAHRLHPALHGRARVQPLGPRLHVQGWAQETGPGHAAGIKAFTSKQTAATAEFKLPNCCGEQLHDESIDVQDDIFERREDNR